MRKYFLVLFALLLIVSVGATAKVSGLTPTDKVTPMPLPCTTPVHSAKATKPTPTASPSATIAPTQPVGWYEFNGDGTVTNYGDGPTIDQSTDTPIPTDATTQ